MGMEPQLYDYESFYNLRLNTPQTLVSFEVNFCYPIWILLFIRERWKMAELLDAFKWWLHDALQEEIIFIRWWLTDELGWD